MAPTSGATAGVVASAQVAPTPMEPAPDYVDTGAAFNLDQPAGWAAAFAIAALVFLLLLFVGLRGAMPS